MTLIHFLTMTVFAGTMTMAIKQMIVKTAVRNRLIAKIGAGVRIQPFNHRCYWSQGQEGVCDLQRTRALDGISGDGSTLF